MPKNFVHCLVTLALTCDLIQTLKVEQSQANVPCSAASAHVVELCHGADVL